MREPLPILLLLDLATDSPLLENELLPRIRERAEDVKVLRATKYGARPSRTGSPGDWRSCSDAIAKMVEEARRMAREANATPRYYVAGRAGLPLFAQLGCELSSWADVVVINRRRDGSWDEISPVRTPQASREPFFSVSGIEGATASGRVSILVSTSPPRQGNEAAHYLALQDETCAGTVVLQAIQTDASGRAYLEAANAAQAAHELEGVFTALPAVFPNAVGTAIFIDGPASLALLVGRALNPRVLRHPAWVPNFDGAKGGGYYPAVTLPHVLGPEAHAPADQVAVTILHADNDAPLLHSLQSVLQPMVRDGRIRAWDRERIPPGAVTDGETRSHVDDAHIVVALVSANLLANQGLMTCVERVLRSEKATGARLVPVLVRPCDWEDSVLGGRQILPKDGRAITSYSDADEAWTSVKKDLGLVIAELRAARAGEARTR